MRVLHVVPSLDPATGGPSRSVPALAEAMARLGHEVSLFTTSWPCRAPAAESSECFSAGGVRVTTFPARLRPWFGGLPHSPRLVAALTRVASQFDIVHVHSVWNPVASFAMRRLRRIGVPYCLTPRGMLDPVVLQRNRWKKIPWALLYENRNIASASLLHFTTRAEETKAAEATILLPPRVVVSNVIDVASWRELPPRGAFEDRFPATRERDVILFVGRINWVKNLDDLVRALPGTLRRRPGAMLVCVGPDTDGDRARLERLAESEGVSKRVLFTGPLQGESLREAYARGDVFALVSKKENFGMAAAEALASGLPLVLSTGVDLGTDLDPTPLVRRVEARAAPIADALVETLDWVSRNGRPSAEARALAASLWGPSVAEDMIRAYRKALDASVRHQR